MRRCRQRRPPGRRPDIRNLFVLAPSGRDANVIITQLAAAGLVGIVADAATILAAIRSDSVGAVILTTEALEGLDKGELRQALADQAPWSDCPLLLLTPRGYVPGSSRRAIDGLGNIVVLERPLHPSTLVTAATMALRARERQLKARDYLAQQQAAEAEVRSLAATLEARVIARTIELTDAMAERARVEERLRESEERYRLTVELGAQVPWTASPGFEILNFGKVWRAPEDGPGLDFRSIRWLDRVQPDARATLMKLWRDASDKRQPLDCEVPIRGPQDATGWYRVRASPRLADDGTILRWYGTIEDIDEQKQTNDRLQQLQSELIHASRITAMGTMASALAHELHQPLSAVANYVRGSRRLLETNPDFDMPAVVQALAEADNSAVRAGEIVRRLREMVAHGRVIKRPCQVSALIDEAQQLALLDSASLGVKTFFDIVEATVEVDRIQIQQVLLNLIRNAVEALQAVDRREIHIATRIVGTACEVSVRDTGPGIAAAAQARLFDPFNSTKSSGMGVGLSISRTIIEAHGGLIGADPAPGGGTIFRFTLPLGPAPVPPA